MKDPKTVGEGLAIASTSGQRVANNSVRHSYRVLSDEEKAAVLRIEDAGLALTTALADCCPDGRDYQNAMDRAKEATMWGVRSITS